MTRSIKKSAGQLKKLGIEEIIIPDVSFDDIYHQMFSDQKYSSFEYAYMLGSNFENSFV